MFQSNILDSRRALDLTMLVIQLYHVITIPYRCAFLTQYTLASLDYVHFIFLDFLCLITLGFDLFLMTWFSANDVTSQVITADVWPKIGEYSFLKITQLRAPQSDWITSTWFYYRLASIIPFEVFASILLTDPANVRYFLLPRLLGSVYIKSLLKVLFQILEDQNVLRNIGLQRMCVFFSTMTTFAHVCGCLFYAVSLSDATTKPYPSQTWGQLDGLWQVQVLDNGQVEFDYTEPLYHRYLRSVYWACVTMVTTGFGDIVPITANETIVCIVSMYIGMCITCTAIANLTLVVTNLDAGATLYQQKMDNLTKYMQYRNMPSGLSTKIRRFYEYMWISLKGVDEKQFLRDLPKPLQQRVTGLMTRDLLLRVSALRKASALLMSILVELLEQHVFSPNDVLVQPRDTYRGLMLLARGEIMIMAKNEKTIQKIIVKDEHLGVEALFEDAESPTTIKAKMYCEVFILPKEKFRNIVRIYCSTDEIDEMKRIIDVTIKSNLKLQKFAGVDQEVKTKGWAGRFLPDSKFRMIWNALKVVFLTYHLFTLPIHFFKSLEVTEFAASRVLGMCIGYIIDVFFVAHYVFEFNYFAYTQEGVVVTGSHLIRAEFTKQGFVRPLLLLMSALPLDILGTFILAEPYISTVRLLKLPRLLYLRSYSRDLTSILAAADLNFSTNFLRIGGLNLVLITVCHWVGCIWIFAARIGTSVGETRVWTDEVENPNLAINHDDFGSVGYYIRSVYWAMVAMSTVGYGDIIPQNIVETVISILVILIGGLVLPAVVGGLASLMSNLNPSMAEFQHKMVNLKTYMTQKSIPSSLRQKIIRYYDYLWSRQGGVDETVILNDLPMTLRIEVANFINGSMMRKIPFFENSGDQFLRVLVSELIPRTFIPNDVIVSAGEIGTEMFLIERGLLTVNSADRKTVYATLAKNDYFGEGALLEATKRNATVVASTYCDCFVLSKESFDLAMEDFPDSVTEVKARIVANHVRKSRKNSTVNRNFSKYSKLTLTTSDLSSSKDVGNTLTKSSSSSSVLKKTGSTRGGLPTSRFWIPGSRFRSGWNILMIFIVLYNMILIPFRISFESISMLMCLDYILDCFLMLDVYMNLRKFGFLFEGSLHLDSEEIMTHYRAQRLSYVCDVVSCVPIDIVGLVLTLVSSTEAVAILPIMRLPKLLRIIHIVEYVTNLNTILRQMTFINDISLIKLMELLFGVTLVAHWAGCFFYLTSWIGNPLRTTTCALKSHSRLSSTTVDLTEHAECVWKDTWIQKQIQDELLPPDGGDNFSRYLRSFNWALPTLVVVVIGDVVPVSVSETLYCLIWMYAGVTINAVIIGNIANLVADLETEQSQFIRRVDKIKNYMFLNHVAEEMSNRAQHYLDYLWSSQEGINESLILMDLPHSLQIAISNALRKEFIQSCPIFDTCDDSILRDVAHVLITQLYSAGDIVLQEGDMGAEMYIISSGVVSVLGPKGTVYATLAKGSFFGESALFFSQRRTATIVADDFTELLILKRDLFETILEAHYHDFDEMVETFLELQESNRRRNSAVASNVNTSKTHGSKLNRIIDESMQLSLIDAHKKRKDLVILAQSNVRALWDITLAWGIIYSCLSLPFTLAFVTSELGYVEGYFSLFVLDYVFDGFFLINIYMRHHFTYVEAGQEVKDLEKIKMHYRKTGLLQDTVANIPWDVLAWGFVATPTYVPLLRLNRLLRLARLRPTLRLIDQYLSKWRFRISSAATKLVHAFLYLFMVNHWYACVWIWIYRYVEEYTDMSWAGHDALSVVGEDISARYIRAFYFVITTLSTVGYGDIRPWRNIETIFELIVILTSACMFAGIIGQFTAYFQYLDSDGVNAFKSKLNSLRSYMSYRELPNDLQQAILSHHKFLWKRKQCLDEENVTQDLPLPMRMEIALIVNIEVIQLFPPLRDMSSSFHKRLALILKPQLCSASSFVYREGDAGSEMYLIARGTLYRRTFEKQREDSSTNNRGNAGGDPQQTTPEDPPQTTQVEDPCDITNTRVWRDYARESHGIMIRGEYFGEQSLTSSTNLRRDEIESYSYAELYILSRDDLDRLLFYLPGFTRVQLIRDLLRLAPETNVAELIRRNRAGGLLEEQEGLAALAQIVTSGRNTSMSKTKMLNSTSRGGGGGGDHPAGPLTRLWTKIWGVSCNLLRRGQHIKTRGRRTRATTIVHPSSNNSGWEEELDETKMVEQNRKNLGPKERAEAQLRLNQYVIQNMCAWGFNRCSCPLHLLDM